ncbi:MAG: MBL fold metallo-hydrolase [Candidatus Eremiobacterota bacterium]
MNENSSGIIQFHLSGMLNSFCIKGEKAVLIDAGTPGDGEKILEYLPVYGLKPQDISLILITHCHFDHFGGLSVLKEKTGAPVAVHKSGAELLKEGKNNLIIPCSTTGTVLKYMMKAFPPKMVSGVTADILIDEELALKDFGIKGKIISTPGHTPDSVSVILDSGEAIVGDLVMAFLNKKVPSYPMFASDMTEVKKSIKIFKNVSKVYAAHGGPFTREAMLRSFMNDMR